MERSCPDPKQAKSNLVFATTTAISIWERPFVRTSIYYPFLSTSWSAYALQLFFSRTLSNEKVGHAPKAKVDQDVHHVVPSPGLLFYFLPGRKKEDKVVQRETSHPPVRPPPMLQCSNAPMDYPNSISLDNW
jgi:hypothetical protein